MPSITLSPVAGWAVGETISAYVRDSRNVVFGSAAATAVVAANSTTTFTGLDADERFIATDGTNAVRFDTLTDPAGDGSGLPPGGDVGDVVVNTGSGTGEWAAPEAVGFPVGTDGQIVAYDSGGTPVAITPVEVTATDVPFTPSGNIAATNAGTALTELDSEKVAKATLTTKGDLYVATAAGTVTRIGVGSDGQILAADSGQTPGIKWTASPSGGILATTIDAKGDLLVGTADDTVARLAVGSNNQVLTADSTQTTGMKWAAAGSSGVSPIATRRSGRTYVANDHDSNWSWAVGTADNYCALVNNRAYSVFAEFANACTIANLACKVTTAMGTGGTLRWAVFDSTDTVVFATATAAADTTGWKTSAAGGSIPAAGVYRIMVVGQNDVTSAGAIKGMAPKGGDDFSYQYNRPFGSSGHIDAVNKTDTEYQASVSGSPTSFTAGGVLTGGPIIEFTIA